MKCPKNYYPSMGLNPLHPVHDWCYVRRLARAAMRGDDINPILYDGEPRNGNLLAGTHRLAANVLLDRLGHDASIDMVALDDVVSAPEDHGLSAEDAEELLAAVQEGDTLSP